MQYKDYEYKRFMQIIADGACRVCEVSLREWERVSTRRTLKCTNRDNEYDHLYIDTEYIYQVQVELEENGERVALPELIEFDDQEQAEKVYEELLKRRATK